MTIYEAQKGGPDGEEALRSFLKKYEYSGISTEMVYLRSTSSRSPSTRMQTYEREGNIGGFSIEDCQDRARSKPSQRAEDSLLDTSGVWKVKFDSTEPKPKEQSYR